MPTFYYTGGHSERPCFTGIEVVSVLSSLRVAHVYAARRITDTSWAGLTELLQMMTAQNVIEA